MKATTKEELIEALDSLEDGTVIHTEYHIHDYIGSVHAEPATRLETVTCLKRFGMLKILDAEKIERYEDSDEELGHVTVLR